MFWQVQKLFADVALRLQEPLYSKNHLSMDVSDYLMKKRCATPMMSGEKDKAFIDHIASLYVCA